MRWQDRRQSSNVEDRRGRRTPMGGGGLPIPLGLFRGKALLVVLVIIVLLRLFGGGSLGGLMGGEEQSAPVQQNDDLARFVSVVLAETEDVWHQVFRQAGGTYREPGMVLYSGATQSGCGYATAGTGPFYCPADEKIYLDLSFFNELQNKFKAPGDYAMAYVIAHEVGHHVQKLTGVIDKMEELRGRLSTTEYNKYNVRMELQADYLAGVFTAHIQEKGILDVGDVDEAMNAANQIGDDRLQELTRGEVEPDLFTHGTSEQRKRWFMKGYESGTLREGDTFSIPYEDL